MASPYLHTKDNSKKENFTAGKVKFLIQMETHIKVGLKMVLKMGKESSHLKMEMSIKVILRMI